MNPSRFEEEIITRLKRVEFALFGHPEDKNYPPGIVYVLQRWAITLDIVKLLLKFIAAGVPIGVAVLTSGRVMGWW